jgi:hypothetical protein
MLSAGRAGLAVRREELTALWIDLELQQTVLPVGYASSVD